MPHTRLHALVPGSVLDARRTGELRGIYHAETGVLNVLPPDTAAADQAPLALAVAPDADALPAWAKDVLSQANERQVSTHDLLARIISETHGEKDERPQEGTESAAPEGTPELALAWDGDELVCVGTNGVFEVERYDLTREVFSRNTGILETDLMAGKRVVILGCGSVGSLAALELARAGVGGFLLVDTDVLEYHNVCRHQCGISEVGLPKVEAVRNRILDINPAARVETVRRRAQDLPKSAFDAWCVPNETLVIGCADNREADAYANRVTALYNVAFLSIGFWERAFAGEIFYHLPGEGQACYECALGSGGLGQRVEANHHIYTTQTDLERVNFEPGISADINFVTMVGVKLALDILNRKNNRYTPRLLAHLTQYTLVCNTNDPAVGGPMAEIFSHPLQVTTSLTVTPHADCTTCGFAAGEREARP